MLGVLALGLPACGEETAEPTEVPPWVLDVEAPPPLWLSGAGLFDDVSARTPAVGVRPYEPRHALWSSGADKERLVYLPPGTRIDTSDAAEWRFPVGTVLVKTFTYDDLEGRAGPVAVETRLLFQRASGWSFALYRWGADGREARLVDEPRWGPLTVTLRQGEGTLRHTLPGLLDCRACHETNRYGPVIGLSPVNYDPDAEGLYDALPPTPVLPGRDEAESAVMGYLVGNCTHCHHGEARGENASFSLLPADLVANTVGQATAGSASGTGVRVVPGDLEGSALYEAVVRAQAGDYAGDFKPMPPVGIDRLDPQVEGLLRAWIESL